MTDKRRIDRLIFVYNADSGSWNAVIDSAKKLFMIDGCALCSITHGLAGERAEWKECKDELGVPIDFLHRNEIPQHLKELAAELPCVIADVAGEHRVLLKKDVLDRCKGDVSDFKGRLQYHAVVNELELPLKTAALGAGN